MHTKFNCLVLENQQKGLNVAKERKYKLLERAKKIDNKPKLSKKKEQNKKTSDIPNAEQLNSYRQKFAILSANNRKLLRKKDNEIRQLKLKNKLLRKRILFIKENVSNALDIEHEKIKKAQIANDFREQKIQEGMHFLEAIGYNLNSDTNFQDTWLRNLNILNILVNNYLHNQKTYETQKAQTKNLQTKIKELNNKNASLEKINADNTYLIAHMQKRNRKNVQALNALRDRQRSEIWIKKLITNLTTDNFNEYLAIEELNDDLLKVYDQITKQHNKLNILQTIYGYLKIKDNQTFIHDITSDSDWPLQTDAVQRLNPYFKDGVAIKAQRTNNDTFHLTHVYNALAKIKQHRPRLKKDYKEKKNPTKVSEKAIKIINPYKRDWIARLHIVVVGNKRAQAFTNELRKYARVRLYDAYEDRGHEIQEAMDWADYVFLLIDSIPHSITNYTKSKADLRPGSIKVQVFNNPNRYDGIARLNYLFEKLH